ncbi:MAG: hypothetical protein ACTSQF_01720 [Candidatus Heimdallarchaeaceae archaeon]
MSDDFDFDKYWLRVLSMCLDDFATEEIKEEILAGSENISSKSSREEVYMWSEEAMDKMDTLLDENQKYEIMTGCSCQYPRANLQEFKQLYAETKDLELVHSKMQEQFEIFLNESLKLEDKYVNEIVKRGMGMAGRIEGRTIIATKIPKSAYIKDWFDETDPNKKRALFCHCPRIRDVLTDPSKKLPEHYCLCGAGFYKGIWEEVLQIPVKVEVVESVMEGDEVCKIAIHLPE